MYAIKEIHWNAFSFRYQEYKDKDSLESFAKII